MRRRVLAERQARPGFSIRIPAIGTLVLKWLSPPWLSGRSGPFRRHSRFTPHPGPLVLSAALARSAATIPGRRISPLIVGISLLAGCDIPTTVPRWETHWVVRSETTTIPVSSFFASEISDLGNEFQLSVTGGTVSETLADICPACIPFNGTVVPKPAFTATLRSDVPFPVDLDSLTLTRGTLEVSVTNRMGFDPIRPAAAAGAARGQITIVISNESTVLGTHTIDGAVRAFAPGATLTETITLSSAVLPKTIGGAVKFDVIIQSPLGDPVAINTAEFLLIEAAEASIGASGAKVRVEDRQVSAAPITLDLAGIDAELTRRVQRGALLLDVENPFAVDGVLTATLSAPGVSLVRSLPVVPGSSHIALEFSGAELRSLFGPSPVTLSVSGPVSASPAGLVSVFPGQALMAAGRLELYLTTNAPEDGQ
jgi:hypothetical protein